MCPAPTAESSRGQRDRPSIDDELAVDVKSDRGTEFLAFGDLISQRVGDLSETVIAVAVHDIVHRAIMRRVDQFRGRIESTERQPAPLSGAMGKPGAGFGIADVGRNPFVPLLVARVLSQLGAH